MLQSVAQRSKLRHCALSRTRERSEIVRKNLTAILDNISRVLKFAILLAKHNLLETQPQNRHFVCSTSAPKLFYAAKLPKPSLVAPGRLAREVNIAGGP